MRIIAYTYEADCHCLDCASNRFQIEPHKRSAWKNIHLDENYIPMTQEDVEGNLIRPVFSTDELPTTHCGTCRQEIE